MTSKAVAIQETRDWLERMVIGLQLCPFAQVPYSQGRLRFSAYRANNMSMWLQFVYDEVEHLISAPADILSNSLLIFPKGPEDFEDFLDLVSMTESLIQERGLTKEVQLAHFHPQYQFAQVEKDDPSNYTNRSPYPTLHLLRVQEVSAAIDSHPDIHDVSPRNIKLLRQLGEERIKDVLSGGTIDL